MYGWAARRTRIYAPRERDARRLLLPVLSLRCATSRMPLRSSRRPTSLGGIGERGLVLHGIAKVSMIIWQFEPMSREWWQVITETLKLE